MKIKWKKLLICIAVPLGVGGLSALISGNAMASFENVIKPPLTPPGWLFPVAWTVLYILMGLASYSVTESDDPTKKSALIFYGVQLGINFFWSLIFFNLSAYLFAFIWILALWVTILVTMLKFYRLNERAGNLLFPYIVWVTFAAYLNYGVYLLN